MMFADQSVLNMHAPYLRRHLNEYNNIILKGTMKNNRTLL